MMKMRTAIAALLLLGTMVGAVSAADIPRSYTKAPAYFAPTAYDWTGFYVGLNGGYGFGNTSWADVLGILNTGDFRVKGAVAGGTLGYNVQVGSVVYGLEADVDYSWIKGTESNVCGTPPCETRNTWLATGRGRLGYAFDRWLPFITGGAAYGNIKMDPGFGGPTETKSKLGWTLGAGVEYAFMHAWTVKAEYLYVDLGKATCSAATCLFDTNVKFNTNLVRAGLNYRF